jgi:hypothetical protein
MAANDPMAGLEVGTGPTPKLLDFWKTLWHVDVHKDHGNTYDADIINSFLPEPTYTTDQQIDDKYKISKEGELANRNGGDGNVLGFTELLKYLTNIDFSNIQKEPPGFTTESNLNVELMGKSVTYDIKVFDDKGLAGDSKIDEFIGQNNIALFVDTSSHLPELLKNYNEEKKIVYAYTRELESDPAGKTTYLTIEEENQNRFFYELPAPNNPTVIAYPPYLTEATEATEATDGMSYFYCKYPVFLSNDGIRELKKYNLKTTLSYIRNDGKTITVTDGANTAGAITKFKDGLKKVLGIASDNVMKEIVFISKHHGDVAQSLVKFRDVQMECPKTNEKINTADYKAAFVSIDVNAIIKALTIETPIIFMYPPEKDRIIVWKNSSLNSPESQFEYEKRFTRDLQTKVLASVNTYNDKTLHTQINNAMVAAKATINFNLDVLDGQPLKYYSDLYKNTLKLGVQLSTLLKYIPDMSLNMVDPVAFNRQADIDAITIIEGLSKEEIESKINELKVIQKYLSEKEATLVIPIQYRTLLLEGANLEAVSFEKEVLLQFKEYQTDSKASVLKLADKRAGLTYTFTKDDKLIEHMWEVTNLAYNIGDTSIKTLECRFGTKLNISWAFDIIHYCYNNLKEYKTLFIETLTKIVEKIPNDIGKPSKIDTFKFGLSIVNVPLAGFIGGSKTEVITSVSSEVKEEPSRILRLVKKNNLNTSSEPLEIIALRTEYDDMISHLEFILDILFLYKYNNRIPYAAFEQVGLQIYEKFFKRVLGSEYGVSRKGYYELKTSRRPNSMKGGVEEYISEQKKLIEHIYATEATEGIEEAAGGAGEGLEKKDVFDNKPFLTTQFSIIELYDDIVSRENEATLQARISRLETLRPLPNREIIIKQLREKLNIIISLISQINNEERKVWEVGVPSGVENNKPVHPLNYVPSAPLSKQAINYTGLRRNKATGQRRTIRSKELEKRRLGKKTGGTRKIQKKYKFKTFKKRYKTNKTQKTLKRF